MRMSIEHKGMAMYTARRIRVFDEFLLRGRTRFRDTC